MDSRKQFEAWISAPPYEYDIERVPDDPRRFAWHGQYRRIAVQIAWEAWQEAERRADVDRAYYEAANRDLNLRILQLENDCQVFARETAAANLRASTLHRETAA